MCQNILHRIRNMGMTTMFVAILCFVALASPCLNAAAAVKGQEAYDKLRHWVVEEHGGMVHTALGVNANGVRGLFAEKDIAKDEEIVKIPYSTILNMGGLSQFGIPALSLLRELHNPHSRFKPYLDILPAPHEVSQGCTMPEEYIPMLQSPFWMKRMLEWRREVGNILSGEVNNRYLLILPEVVGKDNITRERLEYAVSLASTRYVTGDPRATLIMAPIFDMMNHHHNCSNYLSSYESPEPYFSVIAGRALRTGEEVCYLYGDLRDDYAIVHYGFVPELLDPPKLSSVDHPDFDDGEKELLDEPFLDKYELLAEIERLAALQVQLQHLQANFKNPPVISGHEHMHAALLEYQRRRPLAIAHALKTLRETARTTFGIDLSQPGEPLPSPSAVQLSAQGSLGNGVGSGGGHEEGGTTGDGSTSGEGLERSRETGFESSSRGADVGSGHSSSRRTRSADWTATQGDGGVDDNNEAATDAAAQLGKQLEEEEDHQRKQRHGLEQAQHWQADYNL